MTAPATGMIEVRYDDRIVRAFIIATVVFGLVGLLVGVLLSLQLVVPGLTGDLPFLSYGRLRPLHTNAIIFAFTGNGIFAGVYYSLQRLCKARLFSDRLSWAHFWGWQAVIVAAAITLPLGITTSKEYAELEWPIDIAITVVWVIFGINMVGTILRRREPHLYVAIWFYLATWLGIALLHIVNSLAIPAGPFKSYSVFAGIQDALVQWWYGHNAVAFFLTTPLLGLMYYFLPKAAERPVYSYRLSIIHFWALVFIYIWAGPHHLLNSAMPEWAQTLGVVFSVMLLAPSWGGMINGLLTLRGAWDKVRTSPVLKFYVGAVTFYGMSTFEGPLLSLREVNALAHNTDWTIGHVHSGALGWVGLLLFGMAYWLVPRLWRTTLFSDTLANLHFWIATAAIAIYTLAMWASGILQGAMQLWFDDSGQLAVKSFQQIIGYSLPSYWFRVVAGVLYLAGFAVMAANLWLTARRGTAVADEVVQVPAAHGHDDEERQIADALAKPTARERATAIHGLIERWPVALMLLTMGGLLVGSVVSVVPSLIQGAISPRIASVTPYTPLELLGRDLYIREGCASCHTQMVRTLRAEVERYGEHTRPGEHIFDRPFLWGSKRTGPDLAREGILNPSAVWHWDHFADPWSKVEWTVMPAYPWLAERPLDTADVRARMAALSVSPLATYTPREIERADALIAAQQAEIGAELRTSEHLRQRPGIEATEAAALIAYLKRLGTDLGRTSGTTGIAGLEDRIRHRLAPAATAPAPRTAGAAATTAATALAVAMP